MGSFWLHLVIRVERMGRMGRQERYVHRWRVPLRVWLWWWSRVGHYAFYTIQPSRIERHQNKDSRRGTIASTKVPSNGNLSFRHIIHSSSVSPARRCPSSKGDRCIACMTPPPLSDETRLTEADPQGCPLKAWSMDIHRALARRTQGGCAAAREVMTHE